MSELIPFQFENKSVRVITGENDEPWFVATDVCAVLDVQNVSQAVARLDDDERYMLNIGRQGEAFVINESGLYSLILGSRKPKAKKFKKWVTSEVLPSIRKTGGYSISPQVDPMAILNDPAALRSCLLSYSERVITLEAKVDVLEPQAKALQRISGSDGSLCVTDAAKAFGMQPKKFFDLLSQKKWIYKRAGGKHWLGYQNRIQSGLLEHKVTTISRSDGTEKFVEQVLVTPKGITELARFFN